MLECLFQLLSVGTEIMSWRKNDYMTNINIANLKVGHTYKNWTVLCNTLGVKPCTNGSSKISQVKDFRRYFNWEKQGQKITIIEIYDVPKEKIDRRKDNGKDPNSNSRKALEKHRYVQPKAKMNDYKIVGDYVEMYIEHLDEIKICTFDVEDLEIVLQERRYLFINNHVCSNDGVWLHRLIMGLPKLNSRLKKDSLVVHHIDENPLNNRKDNLVIMTNEEHNAHHSGTRKPKVGKEVEELVLKLKEVLIDNDINLDSPTLAKAIKHISKHGFEDEKVGA